MLKDIQNAYTSSHRITNKLFKGFTKYSNTCICRICSCILLKGNYENLKVD